MPTSDRPDSQIEDRKSEIENLRPWVEAETGMKFSGEKFSRLCAAVGKVLKNTSGDVQAELDDIFAHPKHQSAFLEKLTAELTVGESYFLRNERHFRALRKQVFPAILKDNASVGEIRVWSAGCATGEEPYSVAILLDQMLAQGGPAVWPGRQTVPPQHSPPWKVHILATDLNAGFLDRARGARYRSWSFRQTEIHKDPNYFTAEGKEFRLASRIRQQVRFAYLNLVKDVYPSPLTGTLGLDLILFRNVAIYLKPEVTRAIIQRFHRALRPGGWLLLGETEVATASREDFDVHRFDGATLFRKSSDRASASDDALPMPIPALATVLERQSVEAPAAIPDWMPLPKIAQASPERTKQPSVADQIHELLQQRDFTEAQRTIDRIHGNRERAMVRFVFVRGLLACAEMTLAREMLDLCLDEEPLVIEAQLLRATFAEEDGDLVAAAQAFRRALYIDRKCEIAHFHLGLVQEQNGNIIESRRSLKIASMLSGGKDVHASVPHGDGVCYGRLKEMIEGIVAT